ncbi:MAG: tRNA pseudouridine(38-40) synthase TruA [Verrucomicrobia bacterium]|nr:tRNA pseudouridine(38-40) synthase TruA [Verrucomicrobiota bacterium]
MLKFKLVIAYDGSGYDGWQTQKTGVGVQSLVEAALAKLFPSKPKVFSSSRTDTGVHALGMAAHFEVPRAEWRMTAARLLLAVNAHLPEDIRVQSARRVPAEFHARFSAVGKEYRYQVWNHAAMNPLLRTQAWHCKRKLDFAAMRAAAREFVGKHDFRSFRVNPYYATDATVRTLSRCEVKRRGPLVTFIIEGDGFLYRMCRGIVGTLVQVGEGKIPRDALRKILASRDRREAGMTAPAQGLFLWRVLYDARNLNPKPRPE